MATVDTIMSRNLLIAEPLTPLAEAARQMHSHGVGAVLVLSGPRAGTTQASVERIDELSGRRLKTIQLSGSDLDSTNLSFLIYKQALMSFDVGVASAGALFAVVLANIAAVFLIRMVGKNLD